MVRTKFNRYLTDFILIFLFFPSLVLAKDSAIIIFDGSGSMWGQVDGKHKIEIAREVMDTVTKDWNEDIDLGLMVYGHREKGDCGDIELIVPVTKPDGSKIMEAINSLKPKGKTPISTSLKQAAEKLRFTEDPATVILISDGEETCNGDPCAISKELEEQGIDFTAHVIGFDIKNNKLAQEQLRCIAKNTGGQFYEAANAAALKEALIEVKQEVEKKTEQPPKQKGITLKAVELGSKETVSGQSEWTIINLANEDIQTLKSESAELTVELADGEYEIFLSADGKTGEDKITITDGGEQVFDIFLKESKSNKPFSLPEKITAGELLEFTWKGPNNDKDLIFIFEPSIAKNKYPLNNERYHKVSKGEPAKLTAPAKPGKYEVRYYSYDNGTTLSSMIIDVVPSPLKISVPDTVPAGATFSLSWQDAPNSPGDMIFIAEPGMNDNKYFYEDRLLPEKGSSGKLVAPAKAGQYQIRYYSYNNGDVLARTTLTVGNAEVSIDAPRIASPGSKLEVKWTGPDAPGDVIFIAETNMEESRYYYSGGRSAQTSAGSPITLTIPVETGSYEIRYYSKSNGKVLATRALIVR